MNAYDKDILPRAAETFAVMMDFAVSWCGMPLRDFYNRFLGSGIAVPFAQGHPKFTLGMSGIELASRVMENTGGALLLDESYQFPWEDSSFYWTGWALCQYQWYKGADYISIDRNGLPVEQVHRLFSPLHEADITKVIEVFDGYYHPTPPSLKSMRKQLGLSQEEFASQSGVSLRMIRAYEQGTQPISHAEAGTLLRLARTLHCMPEALVE